MADKHYDKAIYTASKLLSDAQVVNANAYIFHGYKLLSQNQIYLRDGAFVESYARKSLFYAKKSGNDTLVVEAYTNLGDLLSIKKKYRLEAEGLYLKALEIARKSYREQIAVPALNLARLYHDMDTTEMMPRFLREAEENIQGLPNDVSDEEIRLNVLWGEYFNHVDGENLVSEYWASAYQMIKNKNSQELALYFYPKYAWFLNNNGKAAEAYNLLSSYQKIKDERDSYLQKVTLQKAMADAGADELKRQRNRAKLREDFADGELERKKTQSMLMYILMGVLFLFMLFLFISVRNRQKLVKSLKLKNGELVKAKETAEDSIKAKSEFFSTVSHEMRTPLYGVTGMVDVLQSSLAATDFSEEFNSLRFSAEHLLDVINDLLELSKLDDRNFVFNDHPFELDALMQEIIKSFERSQLNNTNTIHFIQVGNCEKYLQGDSRRIAQVLINLLSNAIKFTTNGNIYLRLLCSAPNEDKIQAIRFEVEDTGKGIPTDKLDYIFKEFNQVETDDKEQKVGTGLGLAIVKKILRRLNSEIQVESKIGVGTKFSFTIKFKISETSAAVVDSLPVAPNWDDNHNELLSGTSVLVVDDNRVNRLVTRRLLEQKNVEVTLASGGLEAIELLRSKTVDLVLMDLYMPGLDGFETTIRIRALDNVIPIVALTASEIGPIKERLVSCGFNDFISKPFNAKEFFGILASNLLIGKNQPVVTG